MAKGGKFSNGGIGGSGIFGVFGSTTVCQATDNSFYCVVSRYFNLYSPEWATGGCILTTEDASGPLWSRGRCLLSILSSQKIFDFL